MGHVALTANPDFIYTWHQPVSIAADQLISDGVIDEHGDDAFCTHCLACDGVPTDGDLDPVDRWARLVADARASNQLSD
jgi:hypothetical protein